MTGGPPAHRIVSLVPSMTEDLFAVGAGDTVVGVSSFTDYPPQAKRLPVVASFASIADRTHRRAPSGSRDRASPRKIASPATCAVDIPVLLLHDDSFDDIFRNLTAIGTANRPCGEATRW